MMEGIHIPFRAYWSSPFAKWQGSLSHLHSLQFAAELCGREMEKRSIAADLLDYGILGTTIPQTQSFYGLPWLTGLLGAAGVGGPTVAQACATGARVLVQAAQELAAGAAECVLVVTADRTSNGPQIYYPDPNGPGGAGTFEGWVMKNFSNDPLLGCDMTATAENCAEKWGISTAEQHDLVLQRYTQYQSALADDSAFLRGFMTLPFEVPDVRYRKTVSLLTGDEGVFPVTSDKLADLKPVKEGGTVTFAAQTHPADGAAAIIVTGKERARELSQNPAVSVTLRGFGQAREIPGFMPAAPVPAADRALRMAGIGIKEVAAIKSHNPFAVNDIVFARETGADLMTMNNYGCSLIWGHPQGPTGTRLIIELIEELAMKGGGWGLFQGCAAGDTAMAVVLKVEISQ